MSVFRRDLARSCWRAAATSVALVPIVATEARRAPEARARVVEASAAEAYDGPALALAHPAPGGSVPQDRPVVLFRFSAAVEADPVDARSFAVTVDGIDRTALFRVVGNEAWGPLGATNGQRPAIAPGAHQLAARICSVRGVCSELRVAVSVEASAALTTPGSQRERWREILDFVLAVARKLVA